MNRIIPLARLYLEARNASPMQQTQMYMQLLSRGQVIVTLLMIMTLT